MDQVAEAPLSQDMLDDSDSYLLDHGGNKIFVWHGRFSNREERKSSMLYASVSAVVCVNWERRSERAHYIII